MDSQGRGWPRIAAGFRREKALFNSDKYTSTMKVTYVNVVALYIPLASSGEQITAVGADRQPVKVEAL